MVEPWPNQPPEPTAVGNTVAIDAASGRCPAVVELGRQPSLRAMKKIAIIGFLAAVIVACAWLLRSHARLSPAGDEAFRERLAGVWLRAELDLPPGVGKPLGMRCTNTVAADGSFVELSWFSHADRTNTYRRTGTWLVKNGHLIETIKSSTNPTEVTPHAGTGQIIHSDARGFTVRWQNAGETVWQRGVP
ncbi:MAG: hypothetical protein P4N60_09935 [Verrucomicrobiae bacterium]|nr:hypothetical protein [Verrucomicrobiae bacterium]